MKIIYLSSNCLHLETVMKLHYMVKDPCIARLQHCMKFLAIVPQHWVSEALNGGQYE